MLPVPYVQGFFSFISNVLFFNDLLEPYKLYAYVLTIDLIVLFTRATFATPHDPAAARRRHRKSDGSSSSAGGPSYVVGAGISAQKRQRLMTESSEDSDPYDDMD